ncbi:(2Fe-2S)-binding protein [Methylolobus aquaticus]|jgi:bacterioferritin-associated ferredoxin
MYVCICKAVTETQIREAVREGLCTHRDVSRCLRVGTVCGKCAPDVRALLPPRHQPTNISPAS